MTRWLPLLALACLALPGRAIQIQIDYTYDTAGFFTSVPQARAALEAAAADINAAILPTLNAVNTDVFTGTNGGTEATFDWDLNFRHPETNASIEVDPFTFGADAVRIYVGMRPLQGSTLGQGGPGGAGFGLSGGGSPNQWIGAVDAAEAASNIVMTRGDGPIIGTLSGSSTFGAFEATYDLSYGIMLGNLWFDNDSDNNGGINTLPQLANYWHYDHTAAVAVGKHDFYSVALHELLHSIGYGSSDTWDTLVSGSNWLGAETIELLGSGNGIISGGSHLAENLLTPRLLDGQMQEAVMDPTLTVGSRKYLTELDLAVLRDIGYNTIPEPSVAGLALAGIAALGARRIRR